MRLESCLWISGHYQVEDSKAEGGASVKAYSCMESFNGLLSINCENTGWPKIEVIEFKWWKRKE
ncbi:MAG: hypothetical protein K2X77_17190 [Candidatus Obscuribacterales bacterium]|jgi:hypothetical protein|nr:hypothetical protein [Candidatus Obscuribacterales bacterium]